MGSMSSQNIKPLTTVSAVIPCFNSGRTIERTINSIKSQSLKCNEIIVVDDGSNDTFTKGILANIEGIKLITQNNKGLPSARNTGFKNAKSDLIITIDADDWLDRRTVEIMYEILKSSTESIYVFPDLILEGDKVGIIKNEYNYFEQLSSNLIPYCILIPKFVWKIAGGYNEKMTQGFEDWEFNIRLGRLGYHGNRAPGAYLHYHVSETGMLKSKSLPIYGAIWLNIKLNNKDVYQFRKFFSLWLFWKSKAYKRPLFFYFFLNIIHCIFPNFNFLILQKLKSLNLKDKN